MCRLVSTIRSTRRPTAYAVGRRWGRGFAGGLPSVLAVAVRTVAAGAGVVIATDAEEDVEAGEDPPHAASASADAGASTAPAIRPNELLRRMAGLIAGPAALGARPERGPSTARAGSGSCRRGRDHPLSLRTTSAPGGGGGAGAEATSGAGAFALTTRLAPAVCATDSANTIRTAPIANTAIGNGRRSGYRSASDIRGPLAVVLCEATWGMHAVCTTRVSGPQGELQRY